MPWAVCWRLLHFLVRHDWLYRAETGHAADMAERLGHVDDRPAWCVRHRLIRAVDQADAALSGSRGDGWMDRHLVVEGDSPPAGPCLFLGFHFGTGFWTLRWLRRQGHPVSFLSRPIEPGEFPGAPLCYRFERRRMRQVERAGGAPVIYVGGSVARMQAALRSGISVLGMLDVPPESGRTDVPVPFMGGQARFPDGLLRLAEREGVPVMAYLCRLDTATGKRRLTLVRVPDGLPDKLAFLVTLLDKAVHEDTAAWHLWAEWPRFFTSVPP
jgi:hypothetical protein